MSNAFNRFAHQTAEVTGSPAAFLASCASIVVWLMIGPLFHFSDTWQLWANTGTTIVTFLMVFLIQASQNRNDRALQTKVDELIRAIDAAQNEVMALEEREEADAERIRRTVEDEAT